ncbi:DUF6894 family protein [Bradyrhizobium murdochi]|uniref:DUF6894 family protein n=1 Tax=Bradyrhizobium murdochi TaxID=1038859 RepID=UPI000551B67B
MPHYYFDVRDGYHLSFDEEGYELPNIACVREEPARSLAEMVQDALGFTRDFLGNGNAVQLNRAPDV